MRKILATAVVCLTALGAFAQSNVIEIKPRIVNSDSATRKTDLNFQMAAVSGFSVAQVTGNYYLFGAYAASRQAWNSGMNPVGMQDLVFPNNTPNWCFSGTPNPPCAPSIHPDSRDPRCGDSAGVVWKTPNSTVTSWNYYDGRTGTGAKIAAVPLVPNGSNNGWPAQWTSGNCFNTGIPGWTTTVDAWKVNHAITNPPVLPAPASDPDPSHNPNHLDPPPPCGRKNPDWLGKATGTADTKVVNVNGTWYMAFSETVNNPYNGSWNAADLFFISWATSTDGKNWTIKRQLFHSSRENTDCLGGLLATQLFTENGYFYLIADEIGNGLVLLRAPINQSVADGFTQWQIASNPIVGGHYTWTNTPNTNYIDTSASGLNAALLMQDSHFTYVKQGVLARVHASSAPGAPSKIIGFTMRENGVDANNKPLPYVPQLWAGPDFDSPLTYQSDIDTLSLPATGLNGWEPSFTYYPNQSPTTPVNVGNEFDFWLISDLSVAGVPAGGTTALSVTRLTTTLSGDIFSPRLALRTANGHYVNATAGTVASIPTIVAPNTRFVIPKQASTLQSGDAISFIARSGNYLSISGSTATTTKNAAGANETFTIQKTSGSGTLVNGDSVTVRAANGFYLTAVGGGGGTVDFSSNTINANTIFTYTAQ